MARIQFRPFNQEGEPVKRGFVSMRASATREEIIEKVIYCAARDGMGRIVHVEVSKPDGTLHSAWDVRADCVVQTDGPGSESFESARIPANTGKWPTTQETDMKKSYITSAASIAALVALSAPDAASGAAAGTNPADTAKADAAAAAAQTKTDGDTVNKKAPKAEKPKVDKGPSKKEQVLGMMKSKTGVTIDEIAAKLKISNSAARALIGDCQRIEGVEIEREKTDGVSRYKATQKVAGTAAKA